MTDAGRLRDGLRLQIEASANQKTILSKLLPVESVTRWSDARVERLAAERAEAVRSLLGDALRQKLVDKGVADATARAQEMARDAKVLIVPEQAGEV